MQLNWSEFKNFWNSRNPVVLMVEHNNSYHLFANDKGFSFTCILDKNPTDETDLAEFETYYKIKCNPTLVRDELGREVVTLSPFHFKENYRLRYTGISKTMTKNSTSSLEYKLTENRRLTGSQFFVKNAEWGDSLNFKVVDKDNILGYGNNIILDQFGTSVWVDPSRISQDMYACNYSALIVAGLYIIIEYNSVGTQYDPELKVVLFLHKVT